MMLSWHHELLWCSWWSLWCCEKEIWELAENLICDIMSVACMCCKFISDHFQGMGNLAICMIVHVSRIAVWLTGTAGQISLKKKCTSWRKHETFSSVPVNHEVYTQTWRHFRLDFWWPWRPFNLTGLCILHHISWTILFFIIKWDKIHNSI